MRHKTKVNWVTKLEPILPEDGSFADYLLKKTGVAVLLVGLKIDEVLRSVLMRNRHPIRNSDYADSKRQSNRL